MTSTPIKFTDLSSLPTYNGASTSRLQAFYADISRQKHSNPPSYQSTVHWWRQTIQSVILNGWLPPSSDYLVLHATPTLAEAFRYEGVGKPLCLATVIAELYEAKAYFPLTQFLNSTQSIYNPGWLPLRIANYVIGKPLWWALQQLNVVASDEGGHESDGERWKQVKGDYVLLDLVESASQNVVARQRSKGSLIPTDDLYTLNSFREEFARVALPDVMLSDLDVKVLLKFLERDQKVVVVDKEIIKFVDLDSEESRTITAVDRGLLELKTAVQNVQRQIDDIQHKILERSEKASAALRQKRKEVALSHLRAKRQLEELLSKRLGAFENLESTLLSVERAAGDVEIMKSYESSTATLRTILSHPSLQREKIEDTMEAMAAASQDAEEIDETIRLNGGLGSQPIDDSEIQAELDALIKESESEKVQAADTLRVEIQQRERQAAVQVSGTTPSDGLQDKLDRAQVDKEQQRRKDATHA